MTDATDRKLEAFMIQMKEIADSKSAPVSFQKRPDWQLWISVIVVIFYSGAIWMNIQSSNATIEKIMQQHKDDMAKAMSNINSVEDGLIAHIQDENTRLLEHEKEKRQNLEKQLRSKT